MNTTRSKLGGVYPTATIEAMDKAAHDTLQQLRAQPGNKECAECRASPSTWASVSLGVFVCMDCAQVHRNLGTHISKVKSCMGTYLWCPDELERMREIGNQRAWALYTGGAPRGTAIAKPAEGSAFDVRDRFARDKYEAKKWMHPGGMAAVIAEERQRPPSRSAPTRAAAPSAGGSKSRAGGSNSKARESAKARVQALRCGGGAAAPAVEESALLPSVDSWREWSGADSWAPEQQQVAQARVAAPQVAEPAAATDDFDAFFREQTAPAASGGGSDRDLIDLFAPVPAVTTGLLSRQLSAH